MKNKAFKVFIILTFLLGIIFSCHDKGKDTPSIGGDDIKTAQLWYESNIASSSKLKSISFSKGKIKATPDWKYAVMKQQDGSRTVEVPLSSMGPFGFATMENKFAFKETADKRFLKSLTSLVVLFDNKNGNTKGFLLTIIPSKDFVIKTGYMALNSYYKNWQKDFTGYILYHNLDGSFSNGWKFDGGVITKKVSKVNEEEFKIDLDSPTKSTFNEPFHCYDFYLSTWYTDCLYSWTQTSEYYYEELLFCGQPYLLNEYLYTECNYSNPGSTGGGGYTPGTSLQLAPYTPRTGDRFSKPNLSATMSPQPRNNCVTAVMAYLNRAFCGGNMISLDYMVDFLLIYNVNPSISGILVPYILPFVQRYFTTTLFIGYTNAINHGQIVMTDLPTDDPKVGHAVAIIGYHPDGTLIYMDPNTGTLNEGEASNFGRNYAISVLGCNTYLIIEE